LPLTGETDREQLEIAPAQVCVKYIASKSPKATLSFAAAYSNSISAPSGFSFTISFDLDAHYNTRI